jgi:glycosyltransferase involved in cell wall biosynthesis
MMDKPRIVFVSPNLYPIFTGMPTFKGAGGAEVQMTEIIGLLVKLGYPVGMISGDYGQQEVEEVGGVTIHKLPQEGRAGIPGLRFLHPRLTDYLPLLRRQQPDVIYTRCAGAVLAPCAFYARRSNCKLVYASANDLEFSRDAIPGVSRRDAALFRWGLKRADKVVVQNLQQQQALHANWQREGLVVPNTLEDGDARPADFNGPILLVGTVKPVKRTELFIELARALPERQFRIIGGPTRESVGYFEGICAAAKEAGNVEMVGFVPYADVGKQFDGAAALVNTSDAEGFPNTFLQAWMRGVPTLSFVAPEDDRGVTGTQVASDFNDMVVRLKRLTSDRLEWERASAQGADQYRRNHTRAAAALIYDRLFVGLCSDVDEFGLQQAAMHGSHHA